MPNRISVPPSLLPVGGAAQPDNGPLAMEDWFVDDNGNPGHGEFVARMAAGQDYGVAKKAGLLLSSIKMGGPALTAMLCNWHRLGRARLTSHLIQL